MRARLTLLAGALALAACRSAPKPTPDLFEALATGAASTGTPEDLLTPPYPGVEEQPTLLPFDETPESEGPRPTAPLSAEIEAYIEVLDQPEDDAFTGDATVVAHAGEVIELDLGEQSPMIVQARTRGGPFPAELGSTVRLDYSRASGLAPQERVSLLRADGDLLAGVLLTGAIALSTTVSLGPAGLLGAAQGSPTGDAVGSMPVTLDLGAEHLSKLPGEIAIFAGAPWNVGVIASHGLGQLTAEGADFAMRLIIWRRIAPNL